MSKTTTYLLTALVSSIVIAALILAVVATPLAYADEKCNPHGRSTGDPHDDGDTGNPHDDGDTGNPHEHIHCHTH